MDRPPIKWLKSRIALTAVCLISCALVIGLWVRSYWWRNYIYFHVPGNAQQSTYYDASSFLGQVTILAKDYNQASERVSGFGSVAATQYTKDGWPDQSTYAKAKFSAFGFMALNGELLRYVTIPHWFLVLLFTTTASIPWIPWLPWLRWRFSLRTLLIAITVVAMILGLIAYSSS